MHPREGEIAPEYNECRTYRNRLYVRERDNGIVDGTNRTRRLRFILIAVFRVYKTSALFELR